MKNTPPLRLEGFAIFTIACGEPNHGDALGIVLEHGLHVLGSTKNQLVAYLGVTYLNELYDVRARVLEDARLAVFDCGFEGEGADVETRWREWLRPERESKRQFPRKATIRFD